jgi:spermidine dehydrogenase
MSSEQERKRLGMDRPIARRDFLNGMALAVGAPLFASNAATAAVTEAEYPPLRNGLRGNYPTAVADFHRLQQGQFASISVPKSEIRETYDLVVVGAGISGLAAAYFYRQALGPETKILILDNHDDFGGHAKRNEFQIDGKTLVGFGGTMDIATPYPYSYTSKMLIKDLGIEVDRYQEFINRDLEAKYGLGSATFFDKEHFSEDRLVLGNLRQKDFFERAPLTDAARKDLIRLHGKNPDYMPGMGAEEKKAKLAKMSYQDFLLNVAKISPDALPFFLGNGGRNNKRVDTVPALEAANHGAAGFNGLHLELEEEFVEGSYFFHFPDGNATIARLLVNRLAPRAIPNTDKGPHTMQTIVQAPVAYDKLDDPNSGVRIRLSSTVVRVEHDGPPEKAETVTVTYRQGDKTQAVRGRNVVLACYNMLIPGLAPDLPAPQKEALRYSQKVPMMYTKVLLRRWTAFQKLKVARIGAPCGYYQSMRLDPATTLGGYRGVTTPDEPILLHLTRNPNRPGLPRKEQNKIGQQELLSTSFEEFELQTRTQLSRMMAGTGFDAAADIAAMTVNRWPFGYAYTYDTLGDPDVPQEERPHVIGRKRFGSIAIANSDAGAAAFTNQAIDEAQRAVLELLVHKGLC